MQHPMPKGRHRQRVLDSASTRPAELAPTYVATHPGSVRVIGRRDTRAERARRHLRREAAAQLLKVQDAVLGAAERMTVTT